MQALEDLFAPNEIEDKKQVTQEFMAKFTGKMYSLLNKKFGTQKESQTQSINNNASPKEVNMFKSICGISLKKKLNKNDTSYR